MKFSLSSWLFLGALANAQLLPTTTLPSNFTSLAQFNSIFNSTLAGIATDAEDLELFFKALAASFEQVAPTSVPTSIPDVIQSLQDLIPGGSANPANLFELGAAFLLDGLSPADFASFLRGYTTDNTLHNNNPINPNPPIYPSAAPNDAPYSTPEAQLRQAIHIPDTFTYGANGRMPLLMVPGTATPGGINFVGNYYALLKNSSLVDPVWLDVPDSSQQDIQATAELVAYAAHYLRSIAKGSNVTILTWSQGSIDTQWAVKYWPSLRSFVPDIVAFSPDYHGTLFSDAQCAAFPPLPCPPGARQQRTDSNFLAQLHKNDGDSAYVPTSTIYSAFFDEIVIPQANPIASGFLKDARDVGVLNAEVQSVCKGRPAGGFYTHEGILYNNLGFQIFMDAIQHEGPASLARIDLDSACSLPVTAGLGLADVLATEGIIPVAALLIANATNFSPADQIEPAIRPYATY